MPYETFKQRGLWKLKNKVTGKIINVPSARSKEDAERYGRLREAFAHGFRPTKKKFTIVKKHKRKGKKVNRHRRML